MKTNKSRPLAVLWDYDGTLIDTARKNMAVTVAVLRHLYPDIDSHLPEALQTYEAYQAANHRYKNWRELYVCAFGVPEERLDEAGPLWAPEQEKNTDLPLMFPGLAELLPRLTEVPMGICSLNDAGNIRRTLAAYGVDECFREVIGYSDVHEHRQKPDPDSFLACVERLGLTGEKGTYIYVGDHQDDVTFGKAAGKALGCEVVCIAVDWLGLNREAVKSWRIAPDYFVETPEALEQALRELI